MVVVVVVVVVVVEVVKTNSPTPGSVYCQSFRGVDICVVSSSRGFAGLFTFCFLRCLVIFFGFCLAFYSDGDKGAGNFAFI